MQLLRGALIVDGVLSPAWTGDLLFDASGILEIGPDLSGRVGSHVPRRDCQGLALAPGFIDVHTHDDAALLLDPAMAPKLSQGVTTVVVGNCGISLVPLRLAPGQAPVPPLNLLPAETYRYARFADYRAALEAAQPAVNVLALVGHTALRAACMPELDRPARPAELAAMCALLDQALAEGAGGLSSGTFYAPAAAAPPLQVQAQYQQHPQVGGQQPVGRQGRQRQRRCGDRARAGQRVQQQPRAGAQHGHGAVAPLAGHQRADEGRKLHQQRADEVAGHQGQQLQHRAPVSARQRPQGQGQHQRRQQQGQHGPGGHHKGHHGKHGR